MKPVQVRIENFMGIRGEHTIDLANQGMLHIAGRNEDDPGNDSNGSGKSTILEAITWCIFGKGLPRPQGNSEKGVAADEVLNDTLKKQCKVALDLSEGDTTYTVERWRKWKPEKKGKATNGVRLWINSAEPEGIEALDEAETTRLITEHLGISYDIWSRGVVFGQESQFNFCDATAAQRSEILTTVRALEEIDTWMRKCRDEKGALGTKAAEQGGRVSVLEANLVQLRSDNPQARVDAWEADRQRRLADLHAKRDAAEAQGKAKKAELDAVVLGPPPPEPATTMPPEPPPPPAVVEPPPPPEPPPVDQNFLQAAHGAWQERVAEQTAAEARVKAAQATIKQVGEVNSLSTCPTCRQGIQDAHKDACMKAAQSELVAAQAALEAAQQAVRGTRSGYEQIQAQVQERIVERTAAIQAAQLAHRAQVAQLHEARNAQIAQQQAARASQVAEAQAALRAWQEAMRAYQERQRQRQGIEVEYQKARAEWKQAVTDAALVAVEVNPHAEQAAQHAARVEAAEKELEAAKGEQRRIARAQDVCLWWEKELPRFKTWLFDAVVDELASEANRWLKIMAGGVIWIEITTQKQVGKNLRDELDVKIYRWNSDGTTTCRPYRIWSGGEKRRVALAVDLGLSRLMSRRASKPYSFLALDEIDRHLDAKGREGLRLVLAELRHEKETTMVITHDPEFRASFDAELTVTKARGTTSMELVR